MEEVIKCVKLPERLTDRVGRMMEAKRHNGASPTPKVLTLWSFRGCHIAWIAGIM